MREETINKLKGMELDPFDKKILDKFLPDENISDSELFDFFISRMRDHFSQQVIRYNRQVADAMTFFINKGLWDNISQIFRSLPNDMLEALKNSDSEFAKETMEKYIEQMKIFIDLGNEKREIALNAVLKKEK